MALPSHRSRSDKSDHRGGFRRNVAFQESSDRCWGWSSARTEFRPLGTLLSVEEFQETSVAYKSSRWSSRNFLQHRFLQNGAYQYCMSVGEGYFLMKGLGLFFVSIKFLLTIRRIHCLHFGLLTLRPSDHPPSMTLILRFNRN